MDQETFKSLLEKKYLDENSLTIPVIVTAGEALSTSPELVATAPADRELATFCIKKHDEPYSASFLRSKW